MKTIQATILWRNGVYQWGALALAGVSTLLLTLQLFSYDMMAQPFGRLLPKQMVPAIEIIMAGIVVLELGAIAYFLPLALSKLARAIGAVSAVLVPLVWIVLTWHGLHNTGAKAVMFGTKFAIGVNWWQVVFMFALFAATIWLIAADRRRTAA